MSAAWSMNGTVIIACNCDYGCPCNFNALPTHGKCEGGWTWHIASGAYGDTDLSGIAFTLNVNWPGAIHEGNGEGLLLVDERASDAQREAIHTLVLGGEGGPWGILGWTWPTLHGPEAVAYDLELAGLNTRVRAGDQYELEMTPIRNPVSGAEVTPGAVLPQGLILERPDFGASKRLRVPRLGMDFEDRYTAIGEFTYSGPS